MYDALHVYTSLLSIPSYILRYIAMYVANSLESFDY